MHFAVGTQVKITDGDWEGSTGTIQAVDRAFLLVDEQGRFIPNAPVTLESTIPSIEFLHDFDGEQLRVYYPEINLGGMSQPGYEEVSRFWQTAYIVQIEGVHFRSILYENQVESVE